MKYVRHRLFCAEILNTYEKFHAENFFAVFVRKKIRRFVSRKNGAVQKRNPGSVFEIWCFRFKARGVDAIEQIPVCVLRKSTGPVRALYDDNEKIKGCEFLESF